MASSSKTGWKTFWLAVRIALLIILLALLASLAVGAYYLKASGIGPTLWSMAREEVLVWSFYVDPLTQKQIKQKALTGIADQLDAHSEYFPPSEATQFMSSMEGSFGGIGAAFTAHPDAAVVALVYPQSPAQRAGIQKGDHLVSVEGQSVDPKTLSAQLAKVRGPVGSTVSLVISRNGHQIPLSLQRETIDIPSVISGVIQPKGDAAVGVLRVEEFSTRTPIEMAQQLQALFAAPVQPKSLILDLRGNPGGVLDSAVAASAFFLPPAAVVVSSVGRDASQMMTWRARPEDYLSSNGADPVRETLAKVPQLRTIPLAVLIDGGSASASEIVAAALQDNHRAVVVGQRSFGKGSVQQMFPLGPDGAVKITVSRYYTPSGESLQTQGVYPDVLAGVAQEFLRESDLPRHLKAPPPLSIGIYAGALRQAEQTQEQQRREADRNLTQSNSPAPQAQDAQGTPTSGGTKTGAKEGSKTGSKAGVNPTSTSTASTDVDEADDVSDDPEAQEQLLLLKERHIRDARTKAASGASAASSAQAGTRMKDAKGNAQAPANPESNTANKADNKAASVQGKDQARQALGMPATPATDASDPSDVDTGADPFKVDPKHALADAVIQSAIAQLDKGRGRPGALAAGMVATPDSLSAPVFSSNTAPSTLRDGPTGSPPPVPGRLLQP